MTSEAGWLAGRGRTSRRRRLVSGNVVGANGRARVGAQVGSLAGGASEKWEAAAVGPRERMHIRCRRLVGYLAAASWDRGA